MIYKTLLIVLLTIATLVLPIYVFWYKPKFKTSTSGAYKIIAETDTKIFIKLREKAIQLIRLTKDKNYNSETCFLIDMSIESGRNRFLVYDMKKDSILLSGLVAHGSCGSSFKTEASFSNKISSGCSSLGRYKIGGSYKGKFGLSYKLQGLDSSNSNAFQRSVVLHSYECVPEQETYPVPICNSLGCPMISPGFMNRLKPIINTSHKPILLFLFK